MSAEVNLFAEAARLFGLGLPFAMASIAESRGSTPRTMARMLVRADGSALGTIGGGRVESLVIDDALSCIRDGRGGIRDYSLDGRDDGDSAGMLCGGSMKVFIDVSPARRNLVIIGAGHVGLALAKMADFAGLGVTVVDERPALVTRERFPMAGGLVCAADIADAIASLPDDPESLVVIATHADDERALRAMLPRKWKYLGLLGSRRKVAILFDKLKNEGTDPEKMGRIRAPVGLDIGAESPEEIAVSILAEILADTTSSNGRPFSEQRDNRS